MNKLRADFVAHLQLRGFSERTVTNYVDGVSRFSRFFNKSPLELNNGDITAYLVHLRTVRKLAIRTINLHMYSIRSFYEHFLPGRNMMGDIRRMKEPQSYPVILSRQEIAAMIDSAPNLKIKAVVALYNSCGNRHCPQCQSLARGDWVEARKNEILPVPYFHAVFTIPSELNPFVLRNKKSLYAIMFRSVNETMQQLGATSKYLGASIGFVAVLHS